MKHIIIVFILIMNHNFYSQNIWTLEQCIDSAFHNNSNIKLLELNLAISETNLKASKLNFIPTLNANANHGYNWGQTIDPFTNQFATNRVQYDNFYLSSSLTLFSGFNSHYNKKIKSFEYEINSQDLNIKKREISLEILTAYLQVKLNEEIISLRKKSLSYIDEALKREIILENLEYQTNVKSLEKEAQKSKEEYLLKLAENDLKKSSFLLQTLIGLVPDSTFVLSDSIFLIKKIYVDESLLAKLETQKLEYEQKQLKGRFLPTISISGSLGSGYSGNNKYLNENGEYVSQPIKNQINENLYRSFNATISIPIFNGVNSYFKIRISDLKYQQLNIKNNQLKSDHINKLLEYQIDIENLKSELISAKKTVESYTKLFDNSKIQYENNSISYFDYIKYKEELFIAESEATQVKYRLIFAEFIYLLYY